SGWYNHWQIESNARSFCSRSPRGLAVGSGGGLFRLGIGGSLPGVGHHRTLELKGSGDFLERRQLLQRAQPEIVEKLAGGGVKRRPARRLALAHVVDQPLELRYAEGLLRREQHRLEDALRLSRVGHGPILRKSGRSIRTA